MKGSKEFWTVANDWSRRKPLLLACYLEAALPKMAGMSRDRSIYIVDCFAGAGRHPDQSPGAPIHMARLVRSFARGNNPIQVKVRNIEPDDEAFADLEAPTGRSMPTGSYRNIHAGLAQALPALLIESNGRPLTALVDPFAPAAPRLSDLDPLWKRDGRTEMLIVFHPQSVARLLRQIGNDKTREAARAKAAGTLNGVFGNDSWGKLNAESDAVAMVRLYTAAVSKRFGVEGYCHAVAAGRKGATPYHLVFLTRHPHSVALMNDALVSQAELLTAREQCELDLYADLRWEEFVERLLGMAQSQRRRVWMRRELVQYVVAQNFGVARVADHLRAVKESMALHTGPRLCAIDAKQTKSGEWRSNDTTLVRYCEK